MADVIEVEYKATIEGFKAQLADAEKRIASVEKTAKDSAQKTQQHFESAAHGIKEAGKEIATTLGLAFGVEKLVEFGKESVKAFAEAETSANKLKFAVTKIGGEGSAAFNKLIEQAEKLGKTTIFSHKQVEQAQTLLSQFGLTSSQVEKLTPQIIDLAAATGQDLTSATQQAIQGINGQTRGLKQVGITYEDTGSKTKNLAILTEKLTKFQGSSGEAFLTTAGKAKRFDIAIEDIQESIGKLIVNEGNQLLDFFEGLEKGFDGVNKRAGQGIIADALEKQNKIILEKAGESEEERQKLLLESDRKIAAIAKKGLAETDDLRKTGLAQQLKNEQELNNNLRHLNDERNQVRDDATLKGQADAKSAAAERLKSQEEAEKALTDFDKKTNDDLLASQAQTDIQKLELVRDTALAELQIKTDAAREAGVSEARITQSNNEDIAKIIQTFNTNKAAVEKTANDKLFDEAIAEADKLGQAEADVTIKWQKKRIEDELKNEKQAKEDQQKITEGFLSTFSSLVSSINTLQQQRFESEIAGIEETHKTQIEALDSDLQHKVITKEEYEAKKKAIDNKAHEEEKKVKTEAFEAQKKASIISTTINTAQAIIAQLANPTPYVGFALAALAAIAGAAQIAVIESQPTPKFAKGVVDLKGKGTGTSDEIHAMLSKGESVITSDATQHYSGLLKAMNKNEGQKFIQDFYIAPALKAQKKKYDESKDKTFADNLMQSLSMNSNFKDGNLLDSLKQSRKNDREIALFLAKELKGTGFNPRRW